MTFLSFLVVLVPFWVVVYLAFWPKKSVPRTRITHDKAEDWWDFLSRQSLAPCNVLGPSLSQRRRKWGVYVPKDQTHGVVAFASSLCRDISEGNLEFDSIKTVDDFKTRWVPRTRK